MHEIAPVLRAGTVVVNKSTMPVGSTQFVARHLSEAGASSEVGVASNPEFLREGTAVRDFLEPAASSSAATTPRSRCACRTSTATCRRRSS